MDKYIKFSEVMEYLRNRNDEARRCGHEETYFDLLTIIDGLKNMETVPASAVGKDTNVPSKWIPVSERLPEEGHDVLITKESFKIKGYEQRVIIAKRSVDPRSGKIEWWSPEFDALKDKAVLAWMPLPEPYKEGEQNGQTG